MSESGGDNSQPDLLSGISDIDAVSHLLADLHNDLPGKVTRLRYLADIGEALGTEGTMLFGGIATFNAWAEARSSFAYGNFAATTLLCQSLVENLLAAFLHAGLMDNLPSRIVFRDTLKRCRERDLISSQDTHDLERLMSLRNPLSHFRTVYDDQNIDHRAIQTSVRSSDLIEQDAWFAIGLAVRILAKPQFGSDEATGYKSNSR
ncbi:hypothetical protein [Acidisphaera rubrifaciens]|uniref:DUF4145 domain-containing protein n=1 Tax=Acidisphaera rubrifaciens HS-AP3 TaxID=1231350 RepID=A0A0D6P7L6_9PROT|nr:hypothetical protein [Acidisphaera rubrifaciens]GAN77193.1 hypothetical protein Asru_0255_02 [Acidisphaera rubrifaciens HS-AP3]